MDDHTRWPKFGWQASSFRPNELAEYLPLSMPALPKTEPLNMKLAPLPARGSSVWPAKVPPTQKQLDRKGVKPKTKKLAQKAVIRNTWGSIRARLKLPSCSFGRRCLYRNAPGYHWLSVRARMPGNAHALK